LGTLHIRKCLLKAHQIAYLYDFADPAPKTQEHVHHVMITIYSIRPDDLAGDEGAGQIFAWYVMSALGFNEGDPWCADPSDRYPSI
jgi:putative alpha-1,2-mannosidase